MTTEEIFKNKPELLEEKEVKDLIAYVESEYKRNWDKLREQRDKHNTIQDLVFQSEVFMINGKPAKETLKKILAII